MKRFKYELWSGGIFHEIIDKVMEGTSHFQVLIERDTSAPYNDNIFFLVTSNIDSIDRIEWTVFNTIAGILADREGESVAGRFQISEGWKTSLLRDGSDTSLMK